MKQRQMWSLIAGPGVAAISLLLVLLVLSHSMADAATSSRDYSGDGSPVCDTLTDSMERDLCQFVTAIYPDGLLTNWPNPRLPDHFDHAPMRDYGENQPAISESSSMLALYAALIGDQTTFDYLFAVSAPAEIGGTGAPVSSGQESPYYFASPNLCLLHWILDKDGTKQANEDDWLANAAGEENRWLEALAVADQKFPDDRYRSFAECLAKGLIGNTDFNPGAIGNFEDPDTPERCDDHLLRPYFGWKEDYSSFDTITSTNLSYNNLTGWRYASQLGSPFADFYDNVLSCTVPLMAGSIQHCGTDIPRVMYDIERDFYYGEILTPNLACVMAVTATASSIQDLSPTFSPSHSVDCDPTTRWASNWNDDEWIALEFSDPVTIDGVVLKWETAYGKGYTIDVSEDGANWTPVYTEMNGNGDKDEVHFPLTTTRHIRMHGLSRGTGWGYSLFEFEVYQGGTSSLTALDLARRAAVYAKVNGNTALWEMGKRILDFYIGQYTISGTVAAAYDPCTGDPLAGWENGEWPSIMADLTELAAEYCDCRFARQVIEEKLRPKLITDLESPLYGTVGGSAFENLEVLLALRHVDERCSAADVAIAKSSQPRMLTFGDRLTYNLMYINNGSVTATSVIISDVLPAILTNISATSSGPEITPTGSASYTWQVEDLSPCERGAITIAAQVNPLPCCCCGKFINSARITADTPDCNPFNNASSTSNTLTGCLYLPIVMRRSL